MTMAYDKTAWRSALSDHPAHDLPPTGAPYILNRWHRDRLSWRGYAMEARLLLKSLVSRHHTPKKFLIIGRPRSGTTLLQRLLNQVPDLLCNGEMLHNGVVSPRGLLNRVAATKPVAAYGSKFLTYQMFEVQRLADPAAFLQDLAEEGYLLIHVRRQTFDQVLSLSVAQTLLTRYHHKAEAGAAPAQEVFLDAERFVAQFKHFTTVLDYEDLLFSGLDHLQIDYERDLRQADHHQATIDRICAALGVGTGPVKADLARRSERITVKNRDAVRARLLQEGLLGPTSKGHEA